MSAAPEQAPAPALVTYEITLRLRGRDSDHIIVRDLPWHAPRRVVVEDAARYLGREPGDVAVIAFGPLREMRYDRGLAELVARNEVVRQRVLAELRAVGEMRSPTLAQHRAAARDDVLAQHAEFAVGLDAHTARRLVRHKALALVEAAALADDDAYLAARARGVVDALRTIEDEPEATKVAPPVVGGWRGAKVGDWWEGDLAEGGGTCDARGPVEGLACTRRPGHPGRHIATGLFGSSALEAWPGTHEPTAGDLS